MVRGEDSVREVVSSNPSTRFWLISKFYVKTQLGIFAQNANLSNFL